MSALRHLAAASAALSLAATSLVVGATTTSAAEARGDATGALVNVFIERNASVNLAQDLRPGTHKFVVRSARSASFQLVMPNAGYSKREAVRDIKLFNQNKIPALRRLEAGVTMIGGVSSAPENPGVMWADLDAGTYWALNVEDRTPTARELVVVRVAGPELRGEVRGKVVRAIGAVDWAKRPTHIARSGKITFRNDSGENHFLGLSKLAKGKTVADFRQWVEDIQNGIEGPPPVDFEVGVETGVVGPGQEMTMKYSLPRGNYVLVCFWPDAEMGGMPHAFMGMFRGMRVG